MYFGMKMKSTILENILVKQQQEVYIFDRMIFRIYSSDIPNH